MDLVSGSIQGSGLPTVLQLLKVHFPDRRISCPDCLGMESHQKWFFPDFKLNNSAATARKDGSGKIGSATLEERQAVLGRIFSSSGPNWLHEGESWDLMSHLDLLARPFLAGP